MLGAVEHLSLVCKRMKKKVFVTIKLTNTGKSL